MSKELPPVGDHHDDKEDVRCRSFRALLVTQLLGAFNDNLFKTIVSLLVLSKLVGGGGGILFMSLTAALFFTPYVLFSAAAGGLSDRYSKSGVIRATKIFELLVMLLAVLAFANGSTWGLLSAVFFMGLQSAVFSPAKYGILPELLRVRELSKANGYLELSSFAAIILGTACAGFLSGGHFGNPGVYSVCLAVIGIAASFAIKSRPALNPEKKFEINPLAPNIRALKAIRTSRALFLCILGISLFWTLAALFQLNILLYSKEILQIGDTGTSLLLATLGIGIGLGSVFAGRASEGKIELGLVPLGCVGISIINLFLGLGVETLWVNYVGVFLLGASAGFFIVPLQAFLQEESPERERGAYIAASNFVSFSAMLLASFAFWVFADLLEITSSYLFFGLGVLSSGVSVYLICLLPETLVRCVNWIVIHLIYKKRVEGIEHIPEHGPALIVCNHVTYFDAMLLLASLTRPVRFIMYAPIYNHPIINPFARLMEAIPIDPRSGQESVTNSLKAAAESLSRGELVGIFAEGKLTRTGEINEFRPGFEGIMREHAAPIIPVSLGGLWGSLFSHRGGRVFWKWPRKFPYPVTIRIGEPMPPYSTARELEERVRELSDPKLSS